MTDPDTVRFAVRVRPNARRDTVGGGRDGPHGLALLVSVAAPAVDGKANEAVRRVLAAALGVRRQQLSVLTGEHARDKVIAVRTAPAGLPALIDRLIADQVT
ncbi:MAG TPA: DUF167 domain-containing protein [Pseudonocardiaceae bacterium]|jgi:hypothetical protein|nr:DUF167 domain-containing protein [Pseudonocardiaceae bacterium]